MAGLFHTFIYLPMYNALAFLVDIIPGGDVGIAIIILTLLIKFILFPLSLGAVRSQAAMQEIDPELKRIREKYKDDQQESARRTMALLSEKKVNPLASIFLILIQIPIILGLYFVFRLEGAGAGFDPSLLYSFVPFPGNASFTFLGLINLATPTIFLAALVAISQFVNARVMQLPPPTGEAGSLSHDLSKSMQLQMKYVFPVMMGFVAYVTSSAIALYFLVSNLFQLFQELYVKRNRVREQHGNAQ